MMAQEHCLGLFTSKSTNGFLRKDRRRVSLPQPLPRRPWTWPVEATIQAKSVPSILSGTMTALAYLLRMRSPTKPGRMLRRGSHGIAIATLLIKLPTFPRAWFTTLQCSLTFLATLKANCMRAPLKMSPRLLRAHWRKLSISMLLRSRKITILIHQRLGFTLTASRLTLVWNAALLTALSV